jgi:hypothetical protein
MYHSLRQLTKYIREEIAAAKYPGALYTSDNTGKLPTNREIHMLESNDLNWLLAVVAEQFGLSILSSD